MIDAKEFRSFHWTRGTSSRRVMEVHQRRGVLCVCGKEMKRRMKCEEVLSSYEWRGAHGKGVCKD